jgi:hypothetical protein
MVSAIPNANRGPKADFNRLAAILPKDSRSVRFAMIVAFPHPAWSIESALYSDLERRIARSTGSVFFLGQVDRSAGTGRVIASSSKQVNCLPLMVLEEGVEPS